MPSTRASVRAATMTLTIALAASACNATKQSSAQHGSRTARAVTSGGVASPVSSPTAKTDTFAQPGTDPAVYTAKPRISILHTNKRIYTETQHQAAAAWLDKLMHRAYLDFSKLPNRASATLWKADMTPEAHADYVRLAKTPKYANFGMWVPKSQLATVRATGVSRYSITSDYDYSSGNRDTMLFTVLMVADFNAWAIPRDKSSDVVGRTIKQLRVGVTKGPNAKHPWLLSYWMTDTLGYEKLDAERRWVPWTT